VTDAIDVTLTWHEVQLAADVAVRRQVQNLARARQHKHGASDRRSWQMHVEGCIGEIAVAKGLGLYWSGALGNLEADDVGPLQVRTTAYPTGRLVLHKDDDPAKAFILVTGEAPQLRLAGWMFGREAQVDAYWSDPQGTDRWAFFVPQSALRPMAELVRPRAA
jgi:hypothetical protein